MKRHGFATAQDNTKFNPEYVQLQREEVVKLYQDRVLKLKDEIKALEEKKAGIAEAMLAEFSKEREHIESLEKSAKEKKSKADEDASILKKAIETFNSEREVEAEKIRIATEALKKERDAIFRRGNAIDAESSRIKSLENGLATKEVRLSEFEKDVTQRFLDLGSREVALKKERDAFSAEKAETLAFNATLVEKMAEIDALTNQTAQAAARIKEQMDILDGEKKMVVSEKSVLEESTRILAERSKEVEAKALTLKGDMEKIADRERQVNIRERAFANESAIRKRELDEREARVKTLEKGV
jgi:hypothetical protein